MRQQEAEYLLLQTIRAHTSHAVLLCYGCVLIRKLCHLSIEATEIFVEEQLVPLVAEALRRFPEDAILQASVCGCLAVLAQSSNPSKNQMLDAEFNIVPLIVASLNVHRDYSNLTRQVQIYACEVLTELSDYGGRPTAALVTECSSEMSTIELLTTMLRQGVTQQDKKVTCAFCTLLLWYGIFSFDTPYHNHSDAFFRPTVCLPIAQKLPKRCEQWMPSPICRL